MRFKDETEFNAALRGVLKAHGLQCIHVREADLPGPLDLVVWHGRSFIVWIEVKIDNEPIRASQKEFIRNNPACCMVMRWVNSEETIHVTFPMTPPAAKPVRMTWSELSEWCRTLKISIAE